MVGQVSVLSSKELLATVYALKTVDRTVRGDVRKQTRSTARLIFTEELRRRPASSLQSALITKNSSVTVSDQSLRARAAYSRRKATSGGAVPVRDGKAYEFGTNTNKVSRYRTARQGVVSRHTNRAMPTKNRRGYVFYPAVAEASPRILALWVQTCVRVLHEALEGNRG